MNFLAHAYLSFHQPSLITGNLIADFVKGKQWLQFDEGIQQGIRLHRAIDTFTDTHPATRDAKIFFQPSCGKYSAVFTDIVYDHFLATDPDRFTEKSLATFSQEVYSVLQERHSILPPVFQEVFKYMREHDWLYGYRLRPAIHRSFQGIIRRSKYLDIAPDIPFSVLESNYGSLADCYGRFMPDLVSFVQNMIDTPPSL
jgi:acyl carrier protein phosphodiesterase